MPVPSDTEACITLSDVCACVVEKIIRPSPPLPPPGMQRVRVGGYVQTKTPMPPQATPALGHPVRFAFRLARPRHLLSTDVDPACLFQVAPSCTQGLRAIFAITRLDLTGGTIQVEDEPAPVQRTSVEIFSLNSFAWAQAL